MRRTMAKFFLTLFLLTAAGASLSACNTVRGAGEDLEQGSSSVQSHL